MFPSNSSIPNVTVIIPTYNRLPMLKEALVSVFSQSFKGIIEVIVIDDNSQDGTSQFIASAYPAIKLISLNKNVGACVARNLAIKEAKGEYIAFLDSDDLWTETYLESQISTLIDQPKKFSVSAQVSWYLDSNTRKTRLQKPNLKRCSSPLHHLLSLGSFIYSPSTVVFPKVALDDVGLFDENLRIAGDTDLYIRFLLAGYEPIFTEQPYAIRRFHDSDQLTKSQKGIGIRKEIRLQSAQKYYPLIKDLQSSIPFNQILAEIHTSFASRYFKDGLFLPWLKNSITSARYSSLAYAIINMFIDVKLLVKSKISDGFPKESKENAF